jgi:hypothetical protein
MSRILGLRPQVDVGWLMSIKGTVLVAALAVGGLVAALSVLPGSPVWRIFNPPKTVAVASEADAGSSQPAVPATPPRTLEIITLLSKDAIPAILEDEVAFVTGAVAEAQMAPSDRVIGVSIGDDHRAYSTAQLSSHEVVNDTIGGVPVAVTW